MAPGQGELLAGKIRVAAPLLHAVTERFWRHAQLRHLFPRFLLTIYGSVRATVPLMTAAITELERHWAGDPLTAPLIVYLEHHAREEQDHDAWLLDDLTVLGVPAQTARAQLAVPSIANAVGAQYYWMRHAHPVALLGFFAVLEGHPPTLAHLDEVQQRTGLPAEGFRMLRHHARLDAAHAADLFRLLDRLPLQPWHARLLSVSAFQTIGNLGAVFTELLEPSHTAPDSDPGG